jgi:hypothetical protein
MKKEVRSDVSQTLDAASGCPLRVRRQTQVLGMT